MDLDNIIKNLKSSGFRMTKARRSIIGHFFDSKLPLSPFDLLKILKIKSHISPDKTTVYRELEFLKKKKIIKEIHLETEKEKRYEINREHHHHVVCKKCEKIEDIEIGKNLEKKILQKIPNFINLEHSLEFYGICLNCK